MHLTLVVSMGADFICVLSILTFTRDPVFIGDRHLLEHGHQNPQRLFETSCLLEALR